MEMQTSNKKTGGAVPKTDDSKREFLACVKDCDAIGRIYRTQRLRHELHGSRQNNFETSRETVRCLLAGLAPEGCKPLVHGRSKEIETLNKAIASIVEARDEKILTADEADAIIRYMAMKFVERRFDGVLHFVFTPGTSHQWFILAHHHTGSY